MSSPLRRAAPFLVLLAVAACDSTPETPVARAPIGGSAKGPSEPIDSPDVTGARWVATDADPDRLLYGKPGESPLLALACTADANGPVIAYARFAHADPGAQAMFALIGNRRVERLFVDATRQGTASLWAGQVPARDPRLAVLEGPGEVEATIPGAGSVKLHGSPLPGALIERCRATAEPTPAPSPPATPG